MIKLIIFDFDGVIISGSNEAYFKCYEYALDAVDVHLEPDVMHDRIMEKWAKGHVVELEYLLLEHPEKVREAVAAYEECFEKTFKLNLRLIDGADGALHDLAKKYQLTIVSGAHQDILQEMIKKNNINLFTDVISSYDIPDIHNRKPAPYAIEMIMKKHGVTKDEVVSIGDGRADVEMSFAAEVVPIVVLTGNLTRKEAEDLGVKHILKSIADLPQFLETF